MSRQHMSRQHPPFATPLISLAENVARTVRADPGEQVRRLKLIAGATAAVVLIGWAAGGIAQTTGEPTPPPLPPAVQGDAAQNNAAPAAPALAPAPAPQPDNAQPAPQQADTQQQPSQQAAARPANNAPANNATGNFPALPLGHDGVREVQSQLIALGFEPGPADGEAGPATVAAAQQYNENRGGSGPVPIDGALLTRLQQDTGPRLAPEQVAARSQPRYQAQAPASNPLVGVMQQFESNLRALFNGGY